MRGINAFPSQVAGVINANDALSGEYRIILNGPGPYDFLPLEAEISERLSGVLPDGLAIEIEAAIKRDLGLTSRVTLLPFASLPRTSGKTPRVARKDVK